MMNTGCTTTKFVSFFKFVGTDADSESKRRYISKNDVYVSSILYIMRIFSSLIVLAAPLFLFSRQTNNRYVGASAT
jgi:hypothetical protein